ncbi:hypothetical protein JL721_2417 [Aureococcus anophagefferens]|nr:hypothetical protein JL721_2417 [Aureococcus anophagefferens]
MDAASEANLVWLKNPFPLTDGEFYKKRLGGTCGRPEYVPCRVVARNGGELTLETVDEPKMTIAKREADVLPSNSRLRSGSRRNLSELARATHCNAPSVVSAAHGRHVAGEYWTYAGRRDGPLVFLNPNGPGAPRSESNFGLLQMQRRSGPRAAGARDDAGGAAKPRYRTPGADRRKGRFPPPAGDAAEAEQPHLYDAVADAVRRAFELRAPQLLSFVGESGSGKSESAKLALEFAAIAFGDPSFLGGQGGLPALDATDDAAADWAALSAAYGVVARDGDAKSKRPTGVRDSFAEGVAGLLAAILALGDVEFGGGDEAKYRETAASKTRAADAAELLGVDGGVLRDAFLCRVLDVASGASSAGVGKRVPARPSDAETARDGLIKALYGRLVTWVVKRASGECREAARAPSDVYVLDACGFDDAAKGAGGRNFFDELLHNAAAERHHAYYAETTFSDELKLYDDEGLDVSTTKFPAVQTNADVLDLLLGGPASLLGTVDASAAALGETDARALAAVVAAHGASPSFEPGRRQRAATSFTVKHTGGDVSYDLGGLSRGTGRPLATHVLCTRAAPQRLFDKDPELARDFFEPSYVGKQLFDRFAVPEFATLTKIGLRWRMPHDRFYAKYAIAARGLGVYSRAFPLVVADDDAGERRERAKRLLDALLCDPGLAAEAKEAARRGEAQLGRTLVMLASTKFGAHWKRILVVRRFRQLRRAAVVAQRWARSRFLRFWMLDARLAATVLAGMGRGAAGRGDARRRRVAAMVVAERFALRCVREREFLTLAEHFGDADAVAHCKCSNTNLSSPTANEYAVDDTKGDPDAPVDACRSSTIRKGEQRGAGRHLGHHALEFALRRPLPNRAAKLAAQRFASRAELVDVDARASDAGQHKRAKFPTSKPPFSAVFHSFRLILDERSSLGTASKRRTRTTRTRLGADARAPLPRPRAGRPAPGDVAVGRSHSAALSDRGELYTWGLDDAGQLGRPAPGSAAAAKHDGEAHVLAPAHRDFVVAPATVDLEVSAHGGSRALGAAGPQYAGRGLTPAAGAAGQPSVPAPKGFTRVAFTALSAGADFCVALSAGAPLRLGRQPRGQCAPVAGLARGPRRAVADARAGLDAHRKRFAWKVACGLEFSVVATRRHAPDLFAWGNNDKGQLGLGDGARRWAPEMLTRKAVATPKANASATELAKKFLRRAADVACGSRHALVLAASGVVLACGHNGDGQLGVGDREDRSAYAVVRGRLAKCPVTQIVAGWRHSAALTARHELYAWGAATCVASSPGEVADASRARSFYHQHCAPREKTAAEAAAKSAEAAETYDARKRAAVDAAKAKKLDAAEAAREREAIDDAFEASGARRDWTAFSVASPRLVPFPGRAWRVPTALCAASSALSATIVRYAAIGADAEALSYAKFVPHELSSPPESPQAFPKTCDGDGRAEKLDAYDEVLRRVPDRGWARAVDVVADALRRENETEEVEDGDGGFGDVAWKPATPEQEASKVAAAKRREREEGFTAAERHQLRDLEHEADTCDAVAADTVGDETTLRTFDDGDLEDLLPSDDDDDDDDDAHSVHVSELTLKSDDLDARLKTAPDSPAALSRICSPEFLIGARGARRPRPRGAYGAYGYSAADAARTRALSSPEPAAPAPPPADDDFAQLARDTKALQSALARGGDFRAP